MRAEQKKSNTLSDIKENNFSQDGKWRIIHNYIGFLVLLFFIISSWIERPDKITLFYRIALLNPVRNTIVHYFRRVAIISGFLKFEFFKKLLILLILLADFTSCHSFLKLPLPSFDLVFIRSGSHIIMRQVIPGYICAPVGERKVIPVISQSIHVPLAERAVVLDDYLLELLNRHIIREHHTRHLLPAERLHSRKAHITSEDDVVSVMRIHYRATGFQQFRSLLDALLQSVHLVLRPLARIGRKPLYLPGVRLKEPCTY